MNNTYEYMQDSGMYHYKTYGNSDGMGNFFNGGLLYLHKFNNEGHNISLRMTGNISNGYSNNYHKKY